MIRFALPKTYLFSSTVVGTPLYGHVSPGDVRHKACAIYRDMLHAPKPCRRWQLWRIVAA